MSTPLDFVTAPFGLGQGRAYTLDAVPGSTGLHTLRAEGDTALRLFVLDAAVHAPGYQPVLSDEQCAVIGLTAPEDARVLIVVNPSDTETTVNLMAPIVINTATGSASQLILDDSTWPLRAPLAELVSA